MRKFSGDWGFVRGIGRGYYGGAAAYCKYGVPHSQMKKKLLLLLLQFIPITDTEKCL